MARGFSLTNKRGIHVDGTAAVSVSEANSAVTFVTWMNAASLHTGVLLGCFDTGATGNPRIYIFTNIGGTVRLYMQSSPSQTATSSGSYSTSTWHHVGGRVNSSTSRDVFLDGTSTNDTGTATLTGTMNSTAVGFASDSSQSAWFNGSIAESAIYNVALDDEEMSALAAGVSPLMIRPGSLQFYYPGIRDDRELMHGYSFTDATDMVNPLTVTDHPRMIYPSRQLQLGVPQAAAGRTTKNTRSHPLGQNIGMARRMVG